MYLLAKTDEDTGPGGYSHYALVENIAGDKVVSWTSRDSATKFKTIGQAEAAALLLRDDDYIITIA